MNARRRTGVRGAVRRVVFPAVLLLLLTYTSYQLLSGEKGLFTWLDMRDQITELEQANSALQREKERLEQHTLRLYPHSMDWDYVDELARKNLPLGRPEEVVVFLPQD